MQVNLDVKTVQRYLVFDPGLRNALIAQFNPLDQRNDVGQLWENFIFIERLKYRAYFSLHANAYFWRTYEQQEVDLVEERDGKLFGYAYKWSNKKQAAPPANGYRPTQRQNLLSSCQKITSILFRRLLHKPD